MLEFPTAAQRVKNPTRIHEDAGSIPGPAQQVKDLALLWLWCRPAVAPIGALAWELACVMGVALKKNKIKRASQDEEHWVRPYRHERPPETKVPDADKGPQVDMTPQSGSPTLDQPLDSSQALASATCCVNPGSGLFLWVPLIV